MCGFVRDQSVLRVEVSAGVTIAGDEPFGTLRLYLAATLSRFCRPAQDVVELDGFVHGSIKVDEAGERRDSVARRVAWIRRGAGHDPRPCEQLASWYGEAGHDDEAHRVLPLTPPPRSNEGKAPRSSPSSAHSTS
ncbi:hypothetical protein [Streptomyces xantholiticus]|uniref:hypothetical protein n=1 Tax=Streptomyces xantholiticus TaxID=68285 RepID=UPI001995965D|nr:hypothetical protein [Streptomyces xantholiticus]GGW62545.1 hypothetical protein GCM10010381_54640 [Streptomyces xantholiticus]